MAKTLSLLAACSLFTLGCTASDPVAPSETADLAATEVMSASAPASVAANRSACWGQASAVFARTGAMGEHASQQPTPRVGLRNLARDLYDAGIIADDTMASLGAFVADALGLSIDACVD